MDIETFRAHCRDIENRAGLEIEMFCKIQEHPFGFSYNFDHLIGCIFQPQPDGTAREWCDVNFTAPEFPLEESVTYPTVEAWKDAIVELLKNDLGGPNKTVAFI